MKKKTIFKKININIVFLLHLACFIFIFNVDIGHVCVLFFEINKKKNCFCFFRFFATIQIKKKNKTHFDTRINILLLRTI